MRKVLIPITCLLFLITFGGTASASTITNTYQDVTVSITAPDTVAPNTDFSVSVNGFIAGGDSFSVFAYSFKENGVSIDGSGFNWGYSFSKSYIFNKAEGTYKYTFIFGDRRTGHGWYDVAVDIYVNVQSLDSIPPTITINLPAPYGLYTVNTPLSFAATDSQSGVASVVGSLTSTMGDSIEVSSGFIPPPGVYTLVVKAADNAGNIAESEPVFFVVYDPDGGFATGGGWFNPDSESTLPAGVANFGFVANYRNGNTAGNLEFQYSDASINLKSTTIGWLVISDVSAQFQGTGTINGAGIYAFRILAKDNAEPGAGADEFDIKIWEGTNTEGNPYHRAKNVLAGGNIVVHKK